jgi:hypothetical protein
MERNVLSRNRVTGVAEIIHLQFIVTVSCAKHALEFRSIPSGVASNCCLRWGF